MLDGKVALSSLVRIGGADGGQLGTGFLLSLGGRTAIITNRHVMHGVDDATFDFPNLGGAGGWAKVRFYGIGGDVIGHPDRAIDLCAVPAEAIVGKARESFPPFQARALGADDLPTPEEAESLGDFEDVVMAGYPETLLDRKANLPIAQKGVTSTPYRLDYDGAPEFMAGVPCFGGCSGSPVFSCSTGKLLGVNRMAISMWHETGVGGPGLRFKAEVAQPMDLAVCVKSGELLAFEPLLKARELQVG